MNRDQSYFTDPQDIDLKASSSFQVQVLKQIKHEVMHSRGLADSQRSSKRDRNCDSASERFRMSRQQKEIPHQKTCEAKRWYQPPYHLALIIFNQDLLNTTV